MAGLWAVAIVAPVWSDVERHKVMHVLGNSAAFSARPLGLPGEATRRRQPRADASDDGLNNPPPKVKAAHREQ